MDFAGFNWQDKSLDNTGKPRLNAAALEAFEAGIIEGITKAEAAAAAAVPWLDAAWTNLALASGWSNYASPYYGARARRDRAGRVHLRGLVQYTGGGASAVPLTLPPPFIPLDTSLVTVVFYAGSGGPEAVSPCYVHGVEAPGGAAGRINGPTVATTGYVSLAGIVLPV